MKIDNLTVGVDFKLCSECEYKNGIHSIRDNLLVTAGVRAAYMDDADIIDIPGGLEGEDQLADFLTRIVNEYLDGDFGSCSAVQGIENLGIAEKHSFLILSRSHRIIDICKTKGL